MIAQVTNRINGLARRAGCDDDPTPLQQSALKPLIQCRYNRVGFKKAARAHVAASLLSLIRPDNLDAPCSELLHIFLSGRVGPHLLIHGRRHRNRCRSGQCHGGQEIVSSALSEP